MRGKGQYFGREGRDEGKAETVGSAAAVSRDENMVPPGNILWRGRVKLAKGLLIERDVSCDEASTNTVLGADLRVACSPLPELTVGVRELSPDLDHVSVDDKERKTMCSIRGPANSAAAGKYPELQIIRYMSGQMAEGVLGK